MQYLKKEGGCPEYPVKFAMSLWHLTKEVRNEARDLTALANSNTTVTICYTSSVLPPSNFFLCQYGIHIKPFLHLINCLCNISLLLLEYFVDLEERFCNELLIKFVQLFYISCHKENFFKVWFDFKKRYLQHVTVWRLVNISEWNRVTGPKKKL